jgi:spore coat protein U-like protein
MKTFIPLIALTSLVVASHASAATNNSILTNSSTVVSACSISVNEALQFGAVNTLNELTKTAQGAVGVNCTKGSYALSVNYGLSSSIGNTSNLKSQTSCPNGSCFTYNTYDYYCGRSMSGPKGKIPYTLYTNSALTTEANQKRSTEYYGTNGDTTTSCSTPTTAFGTVVFTQKGPISVPVYARMNATKSTASGSYVDTLTFTVSF